MYAREIQIPDEVNVEVSGHLIKVRGPKGEVEKNLKISKEVKIELADKKVKVSAPDKREFRALVGTSIAHTRNAIDGVINGYVYKMKVVYAHFPVTVKVEGNKVSIQNFLGERVPRVAQILDGVKVEIKGADVTLTGIDVDKVSQTAANIEQTTRITGFDKKIFQDGIYIVSKGE